MKETIKTGLRVLFKTAASTAVGWLVALGIEVPAEFEGMLIFLLAGAANVFLNGASSWLLGRTWMPSLVKALILFLWAPPSYEQA